MSNYINVLRRLERERRAPEPMPVTVPTEPVTRSVESAPAPTIVEPTTAPTAFSPPPGHPGSAGRPDPGRDRPDPGRRTADADTRCRTADTSHRHPASERHAAAAACPR